MGSNKNTRYLIPIAICSMIIISMLLSNEWLLFQQCRVYEELGVGNSFRRELLFVRKYPDSQYYSDVIDLLYYHEKDYVDGHFDHLQNSTSGVSDYSMVVYNNAYEEYTKLFPDGVFLKRVNSFLENAQQENEYYHLNTSTSPCVDDLENYLKKYPSSPHRNEIEEILVPAKFSDYSLENGSQPYVKHYGRNLTNGGCSITVEAPRDRDCLVIVKYNDANGNVAGHVYVQKKDSASISLRPGHKYHVYFIFGKGWYPDKQMPKGITGGFLFDVQTQEDASSFKLAYGENIKYDFTAHPSGNFSPSSSSFTDAL